MEEEKSESKGGNIGLPFGLCNKHGIKLPQNATPKMAWDALEKKLGKKPSEIYKELPKKSVKDIYNTDTYSKKEEKDPIDTAKNLEEKDLLTRGLQGVMFFDNPQAKKYDTMPDGAKMMGGISPIGYDIIRVGDEKKASFVKQEWYSKEEKKGKSRVDILREYFKKNKDPYEEQQSKFEKEKSKKKFSQLVKERKEKDLDFFFGDDRKKVSGQYFKITHKKNDNDISIVTKNIKMIKGNPVLITDNNKGVYLKDWQYRKVHNFDEGLNGYVVKLNRQNFKPYTFNFSFQDMSFDKEDTFDELVKTAEEQDEKGMKIAPNWMN